MSKRWKAAKSGSFVFSRFCNYLIASWENLYLIGLFERQTVRLIINSLFGQSDALVTYQLDKFHTKWCHNFVYLTVSDRGWLITCTNSLQLIQSHQSVVPLCNHRQISSVISLITPTRTLALQSTRHISELGSDKWWAVWITTKRKQIFLCRFGTYHMLLTR